MIFKPPATTMFASPRLRAAQTICTAAKLAEHAVSQLKLGPENLKK
jgi:hypothetical protein